jgi:PLP dependent protein
VPSCLPLRVVAVTKTASLAAMVAAYEAGCRHMGENRLSLALAKQAVWPPDLNGLHWHWIGPLQRNKLTKGVGRFHLIQSVETLAQAEAINRLAEQQGQPQAVLLQVNASAEPQKHGWPLSTTAEVLKPLTQLPFLEVRGCMTMAHYNASATECAHTFAQLRQWQANQITTIFPQALELSMGMSDDVVQAVAQGASLVRLGRRLFSTEA